MSSSYVLVYTKVIINCYYTIINQTICTGKHITQTQGFMKFSQKIISSENIDICLLIRTEGVQEKYYDIFHLNYEIVLTQPDIVPYHPM